MSSSTEPNASETRKTKPKRRKRRRYYPCDVLPFPERCGACYGCMQAGALNELKKD